MRAARARDDGVTLAQNAEDLGLHEMTLSKWMRQAAVEDGQRPGATRAESAENHELKKRIRLLEQENQVLRRAAAEPAEAYRANALFDVHRDDPEFGYRLLVHEAQDAGEVMCKRSAWQTCWDNCWWSAFGKKRNNNWMKPGTPVHDDLVARGFTAGGPNRLWLTNLAALVAKHTAADRGKGIRQFYGGRICPDDRVVRYGQAATPAAVKTPRTAYTREIPDDLEQLEHPSDCRFPSLEDRSRSMTCTCAGTRSGPSPGPWTGRRRRSGGSWPAAPLPSPGTCPAPRTAWP